MKTILVLIWVSAGLFGTVVAAERTVILGVEKMTCALCPFTVSKAIEGVEGVSSVEVDFGSQTATVTFDDSVTDIDTVAAASTNAGYPAVLK